MTTQTKDAIKNSFMKLLNRKPLSKITVKEIVEDCGINRNSFYYHFEDIPHLIEEIFNEQADAFFQPEQNESIYGCMTTAIRFALQNKTAMMHIFNSANREMFERYLNSVAARTVESYVEYYTANYRISDENREALVLYYKNILNGFVMDWLSGGMRYDLAEKLRRVCGVFEGTFDNAMRNCSKMKE